MMYMKKRVVLLLISLVLILIILIRIMIFLDNRYSNGIYNDIKKNTDIKKIEYVNIYDNYYIVMDKDNLYLFSDEYVELARIDIDLIHKNSKNYDIIYKEEKFYYMNDYRKNDRVIFEYYDIYEYKLVDKVMVGGK